MPNKFGARYSVSVLFFFAFLLLGNSASATLRVLTTVNFLADLAEEVGQGSDLKVESLMGPGVDPHLYKMSAGDLGRIRKSQLLLAIGLHLEGKMQESLETLARKQKVLFVAQKLPADRLLGVDGDSKNHDPHIWFDPQLWIECAQIVAAQLGEMLPKDRERIEANRKAYTEKISALYTELQKSLSQLPSNSRVLITSHDAFRYFGRAFGFEVHGILGVSTDSEVGIRRIEELVKLIKDRKIKSIFIENSVPPALSKGLQSASKAKIGGELYGDSLGDRASPTGNYLGMLRHNVETIIKGLKP